MMQQQEYQEHSLRASNQLVQTVRIDRDCRWSGKSIGIAVLINNRWCNPEHLSENQRLCTCFKLGVSVRVV